MSWIRMAIAGVAFLGVASVASAQGTPPQADKHQDLVTSIDAGMNAFRPHRRAAGGYSDNKLDYGDCDVGKQRAVDCLSRALLH